MNVSEAKEGKEYIVTDITTDDEELNSVSSFTMQAT